jgi:serine/threonine-protein kinase HipA
VPIGKARRFGEVTRDDVVEFGRQLGVSKAAALRMINRLAERAVPAAQAAYSMLDAVSVPDAARAAAAGELQWAREIRHRVVEESVRRLA